jgi:hypothetical protein
MRMKKSMESKRIMESTLAHLVANYKSQYNLNPLEETRRESVIIARQCLLFILHQKYKQSPSHLGRMVNKNHATILHCTKVVTNALEWSDVQYVDEINKWSTIFDDVMPNSHETKEELVDTIHHILQNSMLNKKSKKSVLDMVLEKINNVYVND